MASAKYVARRVANALDAAEVNKTLKSSRHL